MSHGDGNDVWWTPGAYRVVDGVYRIPLPIPTSVRAVNVYALEAADGLVMVDAGWSHHEPAREALAMALALIGAAPSDIKRFLVTHVHRDHYSYAAEHRSAFGSRVSLGVGESASLSLLQESTSRPTAVDLAELRRCGAEVVIESLVLQPVDPTIWEQPDDWLQPGPVPELHGVALRAQATPGHTRGHLMFVDEGRALTFAGDHVLPLTVPTAGSDQARGTSALGGQLASLRTVLDNPDRRLLPAHGPISSSTHHRSRELLEQLERRLERTLDVVDAELTAYDVARRMPWSRQRLSFDELAPMDMKRAVNKVASYLEHLVETGHIAEHDHGGTTYYVPE